MSEGDFKILNSCEVAWFTDLSVVCAESMTATKHWYGFSNCNSLVALGKSSWRYSISDWILESLDVLFMGKKKG